MLHRGRDHVVANRAHNVARANAVGRGATETVTFEATGGCAVVVINKAGKGTYRTSSTSSLRRRKRGGRSGCPGPPAAGDRWIPAE
ncbi:hypothetical protein [Streptomyces sp. NPDC001502]|uniref:hypothetical protein n=1 Tax=Streptomyces sp. NPDC001502 TaxID=3364578 RepID=UPI0036BD3586